MVSSQWVDSAEVLFLESVQIKKYVIHHVSLLCIPQKQHLDCGVASRQITGEISSAK
ncbi:hypothetical protein PL11201_260014 [Planktothrix sp. PCC 11201]|nr:hypothetical protein PL11201_260014 [Planktothrix sp. PCC 11201]